MSAYIVGNHIINGLITAAIDLKVYASLNGNSYGIVTDENATEFGRLLLAQNVRSVLERYGDKGAIVTEYTFRRVPDTPLGVTAKRVLCLDYQCCETDDWNKTLAHEFLYRLMQILIEKLPGYENAKWGE